MLLTPLERNIGYLILKICLSCKGLFVVNNHPTFLSNGVDKKTDCAILGNSTILYKKYA